MTDCSTTSDRLADCLPRKKDERRSCNDEIESDGRKIDKRTNEKYSLSLQGNYQLGTEGSHLFALGSYVSDYFGAYRNEALVSVGYGLTLLDSDNMKLSFEIGPGMKWFEFGRGTEDEKGNLIEGQSDSEFVGVAKANYDWQISDNAKFTQLWGSVKSS